MRTTIEMRGVSKTFGQTPVLKNINWAVQDGTICGLIGPNGSGKSTLLRLALGTIRATRGAIQILGHQMTGENSYIRQHVQYLAPGHLAFDSFLVEDSMRYARYLYPKWDDTRFGRFLESLDISLQRPISRLSMGQQASLQMAVALCTHPDLLLMDEATNGLDLVIKRQLTQLMIDMATEEGTTVVITSHNVSDIERITENLTIQSF